MPAESKNTKQPAPGARKPAGPDSQKARQKQAYFRQAERPPHVHAAKHTLTPLSMYWIKDKIRELISNPNFPDSVATSFTLLSVSLAFPFFPMPLLAFLIFLLFAVTMLQPFIGLILLLFASIPLLAYQAPLIAWLFLILMTLAMLAGYKHYRTITFTYMLAALPLSPIGAVLEIPAFVLTVLTIGFKRSAIAMVVAIALLVMLSGMTGIQSYGAIAYDPSSAHAYVMNFLSSDIVSPTSPIPSLSRFTGALGSALSGFFNIKTFGYIIIGIPISASPLGFHTLSIIIQLSVWIIVTFVMSNYVLTSRSKFKGTQAGAFGAIIAASYIIASYLTYTSFSLFPMFGVVLVVLFLFILEMEDIEVVTAINVMKQDFRGRFGEVFENLTNGTDERFDSIANYESTKREIKEAVLAPIEHRSLAGAYNIKPPKGILLFGPPGTGKTLLMRALANELRVGFFYVKTSQILSPYAGESSQVLSKIFAIAKAHAPCILFFDEIDGIAASRTMQESDSSRQILSTLLSEIDGFQKIDNVVIVGATNMPNLMDPGIMRPGRFDKVIYMPLPDQYGRKMIFRHYLSRLPVAEDIDYGKLAEISERYSGADIKSLCEDIARKVAGDAAEKNKVLNIDMYDLATAIKKTKPSTSLSQIEQYNTFKLDFERRGYSERDEDTTENVSLDDVIGLMEPKKALYEAVEVPILHPELVKRYDIMGVKGILLFGPPGTGKTMLMKAIATEVGEVKVIPLSGVDLARAGPDKAILSVRKAFDRARENSPSILFIDEIDSILREREEANEIGLNIEGEFLQELDGLKDKYKIVVVAATNRPDSIDSAMLRAGRFDRLIFVPPPNEEDRANIFKLNLSKAPLEKDIDYKALAGMSQGYTGADIANVCRQVKMEVLERSLSEKKTDRISQADLVSRISSTKPSAPAQSLARYTSFILKYGSR